jgi:hypothetical protein
MFGKSESILICISDLPAGVSRKTLKAFVQHGVEAVRSRGLRVKPAITNHTILRLTNLETGTVSHQGLVAIRPAKLAFEVIDELCQTPLQGQLLKVSRYRHCSFEVESLTRTKSISDLLGVSPTQPIQNKPRLILDLVASTDTGSPERSLRPQAAQQTAHQRTAVQKTAIPQITGQKPTHQKPTHQRPTRQKPTSNSSPQIDVDSVFA